MIDLVCIACTPCLECRSWVKEPHVWHRWERVARRKWCLVMVRNSQGGVWSEHVLSSSHSNSSNILLLLFNPTVQSKSCKDLPAGLWYNMPFITTTVIILNSKVNLTPTLSPAFTLCGFFCCFVRQHLIKAETSLLLFSASWTEKILWG